MAVVAWDAPWNSYRPCVSHQATFVIPAKAGIHWIVTVAKWIPAFAGMTAQILRGGDELNPSRG
jgi:hypothetical protein